MNSPLMIGSYVLLWLVVLVLVVAVLALYRFVGGTIATSRIGRVDQGPKDGSRMPSFKLPRDDGSLATMGVSGRPTIYFFGGVGCDVCRAVLPELSRAAAELHPKWATVIVMDADKSDETAGIASGDHLTVFIDRKREAFNGLGIATTPFTLVTDADGRIGARGSPRIKSDFLLLASSARVREATAV